MNKKDKIRTVGVFDLSVFSVPIYLCDSNKMSTIRKYDDRHGITDVKEDAKVFYGVEGSDVLSVLCANICKSNPYGLSPSYKVVELETLQEENQNELILDRLEKLEKEIRKELVKQTDLLVNFNNVGDNINKPFTLKRKFKPVCDCPKLIGNIGDKRDYYLFHERSDNYYDKDCHFTKDLSLAKKFSCEAEARNFLEFKGFIGCRIVFTLRQGNLLI